MVTDNEAIEPAPDNEGPVDSMGAAALGLKTPEEAQQESTEQRQALVKKILADIQAREEHFKPEFEKMRRNVRFVKNRDGEQWKGVDGIGPHNLKDKYVANVTHQLIRSKVSSLYARNPRARARRRPMVDYVVWDGRQETLSTAIQTVMGPMQAMQAVGAAQMGAPGMVASPQPAPAPMMDPITAMQIVTEAVKIRQQRDMIDRIGKTAEIMFHHALDNAKPGFKQRMKQAVRRACTTGVAWVKLDFERAYDGYRPETNDQIADTQDRINAMQAALAELHGGELDTQSAEMEQLRLSLEHLTSQPDMLVREGVLFDFPKSWNVIPDKECQQLIGLIGCKRLAERHESTVDGIKAKFGIDLGDNYRPYVDARGKQSSDQAGKVVWYEEYDATTGMLYSVADGYPDFLCEPCAPRVDVEQFFPYYPIVLNEVENEDDLYPLSEVDLVESMQKELNRSAEALRQHRIAAAPYTVAGKDKLSDEDVSRLKARSAHDVILLQALVGNQKVQDLFQAGPTSPIDPNLYTDQRTVQDILRVSGVQDANLGPTTGNTATEAGIAEASRSKTDSSNVDDLDSVLTQLARDWCRVALKNVSLETAKKIAGPGAVWPEIDSSRTEYSDVLYLDLVAGSSGKPNRERDAAAMERIGPIMQNTPGISPDWMARKVVELVDDTADMDDALLSGVPSVLAMNAMIKAATAAPAVPGGSGGVENTPTGNPASDPNMQGDQGGNNMPQGMGGPGGPQAGNPNPTDAMTSSVTGMS
jgi:hypothetical protein